MCSMSASHGLRNASDDNKETAELGSCCKRLLLPTTPGHAALHDIAGMQMQIPSFEL